MASDNNWGEEEEEEEEEEDWVTTNCSVLLILVTPSSRKEQQNKYPQAGVAVAGEDKVEKWGLSFQGVFSTALLRTTQSCTFTVS